MAIHSLARKGLREPVVLGVTCYFKRREALTRQEVVAWILRLSLPGIVFEINSVLGPLVLAEARLLLEAHPTAIFAASVGMVERVSVNVLL